MADKKAKSIRNRKCNNNRRWKDVDFTLDSKSMCKGWMWEEWKEWQKQEGHDYYKRERMKPKQLNGMTRLDFYVLLPIRSGADNRGHEDCQNVDRRFHLIECSKDVRDRPKPETLYDDRCIDSWKKWWTVNEFLGMGIPTNLPEQIDTRVMFGNPVDNAVTLQKDGKVVVERVGDGKCKRCEKSHSGRCLTAMTHLPGRWFFVKETDMECPICGAKFGGGSTSRPAGSGLKSHLSKSRKGCGRKLEIQHWENIASGGDDLEEGVRVSLGLKWIEVNFFVKDKKKECLNCKRALVVRSNKDYVRRNKDCVMAVVVRLKRDPTGLDRGC